MNTLNRIVLAAVLASAFSLSGSAYAQSNVNEDDGIAASPRVRQMLNERKASSATAPKHIVISDAARTKVSREVAASPRARQALDERNAVAKAPASTAVASVGYQATGADGITASPRARQQLDERSTSVMVAPVK